MAGKGPVPPESAVDPDQPLPGENPQTQYLDDAEHWIKVYSELRDGKSEIIRKLLSVMESAEPDARAELERSDLRLLEAERQRFEHRLEYWRARAAELRQGPPEPG